MGEHLVMDESHQLYKDNERPRDFGLIDDLLFIQVCQKCDIELDPNTSSAKLALEIAKCGLEITPDTDIEQLAATVKLLGIV